MLQPLPQDPFERGQAGQGLKATLKSALAHAGVVGKRTDCVWILKVGQNVIEDRRQAVSLSPQWHGPLDELGLAALAMAIHHQTTRHRIGKFRPEIRPDDMQTQIDACRAAGRCQNVPLIDIETARVHLDSGIAAGQVLGETPVRRGMAAIKQTGRREHEGAAADGNDAGAALMSVNQCLANLFRYRLVGSAPTWDDDRPCLVKVGQGASCANRQPTAGMKNLILQRDRFELIPVWSCFRAVQAKHFGRDPELERTEAVIDEADDTPVCRKGWTLIFWHECRLIWQSCHWQLDLLACDTVIRQQNDGGTAMNRDTELLDAIQTYFDALYACDLLLFDKVFHPASSLFDADEGAIAVDPIADYRQVIAKRESPASRAQDREDEIILIDWLSPAAATVKVRLRINANVFVDHLCFVKGVDGWRIVAKVWHLETVRASS